MEKVSPFCENWGWDSVSDSISDSIWSGRVKKMDMLKSVWNGKM